MKTALDLAGNKFVEDPADADVIVLNGKIPSSEAIADAVRRGTGLIMITGADTSQDQIQSLLGGNVSLTVEEEPLSLVETTSENAEGLNLFIWLAALFGTKQDPAVIQVRDVSQPKDQLLTEIVWNGAPQIRERSRVDGLPSGAEALVSGYEEPEGVLWYLPPGTISPSAGGVFILTAWLSGEVNPQIQDWGYFNYLIYSLVERWRGPPRFPLQITRFLLCRMGRSVPPC